MKKSNYKIFDCFIMLFGLFLIGYYLLNIPMTGIFSFSIIFFITGIIFIGYGCLEFYLKEHLFARLPRIWRRIILSFFTIGLLCFSIVEGAIIYYGEQEHIEDSDVVIVLGAGLMQDRISTTLRYRLDKAIEYHQAYPHVPIVVSGGQGDDETRSEAEAMKEYLVKQGIDEHLIYMENQSRDTYENFLYTHQLLEKENITAHKVTVITNKFHMMRAMYLGEYIGFDINPLSAQNYQPHSFHNYVREFFAVMKTAISYH